VEEEARWALGFFFFQGKKFLVGFGSVVGGKVEFAAKTKRARWKT
jgi:hypothetical protein